jgi:Kinesin motor domain
VLILTTIDVNAVEDAMKLIHQGAANRRTGETNMNRASSRSHSVFSMRVECYSKLDNGLTHTQFSTLHMVDLAGSERVKISGADGAALTEASEINLSLSTLGRVIGKVLRWPTLFVRKHNFAHSWLEL